LLIDTIRQVNFPLRLDKIDNTVSAINIGIQNTQTGINTLNTKLGDLETNLEVINQQNSFLKMLLIMTVIAVIGFGIANLLI
jgi:archaellum component FlaC